MNKINERFYFSPYLTPVGRLLSLLGLFILTSFYAHAARPTVHVIGDSHSMEFFHIPGCKVYWLGPITMHRVGRDGLCFLNIKNLQILEGQTVVFAFGEIDVRCHIGKQRDQQVRNLDEIIETLAIQYLHTILLNKAQYKDLTCIVYSVTPPTNQEFNPSFPFYGTLQDRIFIAKKLNARLAELCEQTGLEFLDVYQDYANIDGSLNPVYSDGGVHIHPQQSAFIRKRLEHILTKKGKLTNSQAR